MTDPETESLELFLLLLRSPDTRWRELPDQHGDADTAAHAALIDDLTRAGRLVHCSPLEHPIEGVEVSIDDGEVRVRAEQVTGDPIAGFYMVRCGSRDEAIAIAAQIPDAARSPVLVRPLLDLPSVGTAMT